MEDFRDFRDFDKYAPFSDLLKAVIRDETGGNIAAFARRCKQVAGKNAPSAALLHKYLNGAQPTLNKLRAIAHTAGRSVSYFTEPTEEVSIKHFVQFFRNLFDVNLQNYFLIAEREIDLLMTRTDFLKMTVPSLGGKQTEKTNSYLDVILESLEKRTALRVRMLALDPETPYAQQSFGLENHDSAREWRRQVWGILDDISDAVEPYGSRFQIRLYNRPPMQIVQRIDDWLFYSAASEERRSRKCTTFGFRKEWPGVEKTFISHYEKVWRNARPL